MKNFPTVRRLVLVLFLWALLTGGTAIRCGSDPGNLGPDRDPPVAADGLYTIGVTGTLTAFMKASDPNGFPLTYSIVSGPGQGSLQDVDTKTGRFTYLPGAVGVDSFSFRATNSFQASNVAVVTIQVLEAPLEAAATKPSGADQVADDPLTPGAMIVLWDDGIGTLQRVYRGLPIPADTLATGVVRFDLDPLRPGRIRASLGSASGIVSDDGGDRWRDGPEPPSDCLSGRDAGTHGPPGTAACAVLTDSLSLALGSDDRGRKTDSETWSLLQDTLRAGAWRLAISGPRTVVLETRDDGHSWTILRELAIGDLRLVACADRNICLMDVTGTALWRFETGP